MKNENINVNWNPNSYHNHSQPQYEWAKEFLERYTLRPDEKVLDIGCGDGKITRDIATQIPNGSVLGIDQSESMIAFAQHTFAEIKNLQFEQQNVTSLPYKDQFTFIFSSACLQWVKDQQLALQNISFSLNPGGFFWALLPNPDEFNRAIRSSIKLNEWSSYFYNYEDVCIGFTTDQYARYLEKANLLPLVVKERNMMLCYQTRKELLDWLLEVLPLQSVPMSLRNSFTESVIEALLKQFSEALQISGAIHIPMSILEIQARKPCSE